MWQGNTLLAVAVLLTVAVFFFPLELLCNENLLDLVDAGVALALTLPRQAKLVSRGENE